MLYVFVNVYSVSINEWPPFTGSISNCAVPCSSCGWEPFCDSRDKKRMALVYHFNHHILPHSQIPQLFSHSLPAFLQFKLTHPRWVWHEVMMMIMRMLSAVSRGVIDMLSNFTVFDIISIPQPRGRQYQHEAISLISPPPSFTYLRLIYPHLVHISPSYTRFS